MHRGGQVHVGAAADARGQQALAGQPGDGLAQAGARDAQLHRQRAFGRQAVAWAQAALGDQGAQPFGNAVGQAGGGAHPAIVHRHRARGMPVHRFGTAAAQGIIHGST